MRMQQGITIALATALLSMSVAFSGAPAAERTDAAEPPEIIDPPGDANFLNGSAIAEGPDTRPASDDRADILRIWPETTYDTVTELAADGAVVAVRHVPQGLRINVETLAPARPATGPTLMFRLPVHANGCYFELRFHVRGPLSDANDPPERPELGDMPPEGSVIDVSTGGGPCFGAAFTSPAFELDSDGSVTWMEFPFEAFAGTAAEGVIAPAVEMTANGHPYFWPRRRSPTGALVLVGGPIDVAHPLGSPYVIGSDVPPDVDCAESPGHPACAG